MTFPEALVTGVPLIDGQHVRILAEVEALARDPANMSHALESLRTHFAEHFRDEERLGEDSGYPDLLAHQREHLAFFDHFIHLRAIWQRDRSPAATRALVDALMAWTRDHVLKNDVTLAAYARGWGG